MEDLFMEKTGVPDKGEIQFDPVKVTSYSTFFRGITDEMCSVLIRTSGSPILSEANDFSACVFDPECECYAMSNAVIAFLYGHILGAKCVKKYYEGIFTPAMFGSETIRLLQELSIRPM